MFDSDSRAYIPMSALTAPSMKELVNELVDGVKVGL